MQSPPGVPMPEGKARVLPRLRLIVFLGLAILLVVCFVVAWETSGATAHLPSRAGQAAGANATLVDTSPWTTAQTLAGMAVTAEEKEYARQAERLADHSVDQAFAAALREANLESQQRNLSGNALALSKRVDQLKQFVAQDQETVDKLTAAAKGAKPGSASDDQASDSDLGIARAQLSLDSDQLSELAATLQREEGDKGAEVKAELEAHEATMKSYDAQADLPAEMTVVSVSRNSTLARRVSAWFKQDTRAQMLNQAEHEALAKANHVSEVRKALEEQLDAIEAKPVSPNQTAARLAKIQARDARRQLLSIYDDRVDTEQRLASVYQKWAAQVGVQHRILLHLIVSSCALVLGILLAMVLVDALVQHIVKLPLLDARNRHTLQAILRLSINVVGLGCALLVIFGAPSQLGTMLGLATAALTIALQDYLLAFMGWFVLIGRRGMRVGDIVEINGVSGEITVGGEVAEIGLMATTLLETGDHGEPTGRTIRLMNGFAIRGQYFNFSTTGQWLWDKFEVTIPDTLDRSVVLESILKMAEEETAEDARRAEEEWRRISKGGRLNRLRARPAVNLLPSADARTVEVRYVTRATDRTETRRRLYRQIVEAIREIKVGDAPRPAGEAMATQG